jgi:hypothetical protein
MREKLDVLWSGDEPLPETTIVRSQIEKKKALRTK